MTVMSSDSILDAGIITPLHDLSLGINFRNGGRLAGPLHAHPSATGFTAPMRRIARPNGVIPTRLSSPHNIQPHRSTAQVNAWDNGPKLELVLIIITYLDNRSLVTASCVCKRWHRLMHDPAVWRHKMAEHGWIATLLHAQNLINPALDWRHMYTQKYQLERRWALGRIATHTLIGHRDSIYCLQLDHTKIVTGSRDRTIKFWDLATFQCVHTLRGHEAGVLCLQYNDDWLVSGSSDAVVIVWSMKTKKPTMVLRGHTARISKVCFDNQYIVSGSKDATIRVWRMTGELVRVISGHDGPINSVQLHGNTIVSASGDTSIKMWDIDTGLCLREFSGHSLGVACIQYTGKYILSGSNDHTIKVWDAQTGQCLTTCKGHEGLVRTLHFDGNRIVSAGNDKSIRVWNPNTGKCLLHFQSSHYGKVFDVQFDSKRIVSVGPDQKILIMDFAQGLDTQFLA